MLVEPGQRDEYGGDLSKVADLLGEDKVGVKVDLAEIGDQVRLTVDSTSTRGKHVYLDPVSADELADLLRMRAREARGTR
jgi:hypothetical protein